MDTFSDWLRHQRNERRLSRTEFAQRVGCSVALLRKIEDGERHPSAQIASLIANALDIPAAQREAFIRIARGEWGADRLKDISKPLQHPDISRPGDFRVTFQFCQRL